MTPEQDRAMMAVLKAIAEARRTGLTEQQISDRIERTKPDKALEGASSAPAGDDAGWNPRQKNFQTAMRLMKNRSYQNSERVLSQILFMNVTLSVYGSGLHKHFSFWASRLVNCGQAKRTSCALPFLCHLA